MIDHFNLPVTDLELSGAFYRSLLAPLGYPLLMRDGEAIGFGVDAWRFGLIAPNSYLFKHVYRWCLPASGHRIPQIPCILNLRFAPESKKGWKRANVTAFAKAFGSS